MMYLGDSDLVIDYLNMQSSVRLAMPEMLRAGLALSAITLIELYEGARGSRDPRQAQRELDLFVRGATVIPLNRRVILRTADLRRELRQRKAPLLHRAYDVIVAATALAYDLTLVSSNERDYRDIPILKFLNARATRP